MEKVTNNFAYEETLKYFKGDDLAARVWVTKYALKDSDGNIYEKTPDDMHQRIASEVARIEKKYPNPLSETEIFDLIKNFKYIIFRLLINYFIFIIIRTYSQSLPWKTSFQKVNYYISNRFEIITSTLLIAS